MGNSVAGVKVCEELIDPAGDRGHILLPGTALDLSILITLGYHSLSA